MSGLTLGLMSLSLVDLEVLSKAGQPNDRKNAEKIMPLVKKQHLLLCTLLICNAMAMEALPIFIDSLLPAWGAILISVTLILTFGEIIPQAICSRYGLSVGAKISPVVRLLVIIFFPISYPISKLLDLLLGKDHSVLLRRAELKTLVDMHGNEAGKGGELSRDETTIITGALDLTQKTAKDAMTAKSKVFSLDLNSKLDEDTMNSLMSKGHSRVPVSSGSLSNIIGLILVKNLIKCRPEDETPIRSLTIRRIPRVQDSLPLYDILNLFQKGHSHMAVVVKNKNGANSPAQGALKIDVIASREEGKGMETMMKTNARCASCVTCIHTETQSPASHNNVMEKGGNHWHVSTVKKGGRDFEHHVNMEALEFQPDPEEEVIGIITMEDVLEELLQEEILDETDEYVDVHNKIKVNMLRSVKSSPRSFESVSPISSHHHTPITRSPISPYVQSPLSHGNLPPTSPSSCRVRPKLSIPLNTYAIAKQIQT
ncbi:DUF21 domain-containing protein At5g52790-like isoform X2 [Impatiens glandulifera]|nr:DUF21 domain-containing protein At5g52790-like isoform X2 [Impatiens glandulifera]